MPQSPFGQCAVHQQVFGLVDFQNGEQESQSGSDKHRRSQYEANRGTHLGKILPNTVDFYFFIRPIILEDFIRLISYNGPCVRLGCSFFLATALIRSEEIVYSRFVKILLG